MNPTSKVCMILSMPHHKSQPCAYLNTLEPILYTEVAGLVVESPTRKNVEARAEKVEKLKHVETC